MVVVVGSLVAFVIAAADDRRFARRSKIDAQTKLLVVWSP